MICKQCYADKDLDSFRDNRRTKRKICRQCEYEKYKKNISAASQRYYRKNYKKIIEKVSKWYVDNIDVAKKRIKKWKSENKESVIISRQKHRSAKKSNGSFTKQEWLDLCNKYENKCLCCGSENDLSVDHIVPLSVGGTNYIDNIQPLCFRCNSKKRAKTIDYRMAYK